MPISFTERIQRQSIFNGTFSAPAAAPAAANFIACRNNTEVFLAKENVLRCCGINDKTSNYRIITHSHANFVINKLLLNPQGTALALVGDECVVVLHLPSSVLASDASTIPVRSSRISLGSRVKKVLWQPAVANENSIVIFTEDGVVSIYDVALSVNEPQLSVDLNREDVLKSRGETASSIAYGVNKSNLAGPLTLYVISSSANVYAIYPFIQPTASISTSKQQIETLYDESLTILRHFEASGSETMLQHARKQFEYVDYLYSQLHNSVLPRFENGKYVLRQREEEEEEEEEEEDKESEKPEEQGPQVQGPLNTPHTSRLQGSDLISVAVGTSASDFTVVASLAKDASGASLATYYGQLKSLIMRYKSKAQDDKQVSPTTISPPPAKIEHEYKKPARGFGYIDDSEDEDDEEVDTESAEDSAEELKKFEILTPLKVDKLPVTSASSSTFEADVYEFGIRFENKILLVNIQNWFEVSVKDLLSETSQAIVYKEISSTPVFGYTIVRDTITEEGTFLVSLTEAGLTINQIKKGLTLKKPNRSTEATSSSSDTSTKPIGKQLLSNEPFEELVIELNSITKSIEVPRPATKNPISYSDKIAVSNPDYLSALNGASLYVIERVQDFTQFAINLKLRLSNQLDVLRSNIRLLHLVRETLETQSTLDVQRIDEKIDELTEKQTKINDRLQALHQRVFDAVQKLKLNKQEPLSKAEIAWYKEINATTELVNTKYKQSIQDSKQQVTKLLQEFEVEGITAELSDLKLTQRVNKVKQWLEREGHLIAIAKGKLAQIENKSINA